MDVSVSPAINLLPAADVLPSLHLPVPAVTSTGDRLAKGRLGIYAGLFFALRAKHPPTAAHSLRVAVGCSKWAGWRKMPGQERDLLEISALLHDIGKIGIPDSILQKPAGLDDGEKMVMEMNCSLAVEMLRGSGASQQIIETVQQARLGFQEAETLLAARMMGIVDAFDSMTTEQVFRRALSRDRAIEELCSNAGVQFDPTLVREFAELVAEPRPELEKEMAERWLSQFTGGVVPGFGDASAVPVSSGPIHSLIDTVFHKRLLDSLADAAIYLDGSAQILHWNRAAERLSGRRAGSLLHRMWSSDLIGLTDQHGHPLNPLACPVRAVTTSRTQVNLRLQVLRQDGKQFKVHFTAIPVFSNEREFTGVILLIRDASAQANLEERVQTLNAIASRDTLTGVANRAALSQQLPKFVQSYIASGRRGSLIMCDIDFFKRINDNYGHQAGDEALVTFANLLKDTAREEDFVARYGGEEFVVLCEDCDNPSATLRAEEMRRAVEDTPVQSLNGTTMTSSFGVTEIQEGDTGETLLARADRALLMAKESGRNRVVQLGAGQVDLPPNAVKPAPAVELKSNWLGWFRSEQFVVEREYLTSVPEAVAIQKLKGFIADHRAEVLSADESYVSIRIDSQKNDGPRRRGERSAVILLNVRIQAVQVVAPGRAKTYQNRIKFAVSVQPVKSRDRRTSVLLGQINQILYSFQAYVVAQEVDAELKETIIEPR